MSENFLQLGKDDRSDILNAASTELGISVQLLEKDVWVCWALEHLFSLPRASHMAFKGGTSLSKVYGAISRFSEDVDVTIDWTSFSPSRNPFSGSFPGSNQRKALTNELRAKLKEYSYNFVGPHLESSAIKQFPDRSVTISISENGEEVRVEYPSAVSDGDRYVADCVLLELGGRNTTEPSEIKTLQADLSTISGPVGELEYPSPTVNVLSPLRTFWEKATLIHAEIGRGIRSTSVGRMSRHWFDLERLADHQIGRGALADLDLLEDVIRYKKVFYYSGSANYDDCLTGRFRLTLSESDRKLLAADYQSMLTAGMLDAKSPTFAEICDRLETLEAEINSLTS